MVSVSAMVWIAASRVPSRNENVNWFEASDAGEHDGRAQENLRHRAPP